MDKKIIVGVAAAAAVGTALYWLLRPTEEVSNEQSNRISD